MSVTAVAALNDFQGKVGDTKLTVVDCFATWCGPCKMISPEVEKLAGANVDVQFLKVDVDAAPEISEFCNIQAMPTFIFFKNGKEIERFEGANPEALKAKISELK